MFMEKYDLAWTKPTWGVLALWTEREDSLFLDTMVTNNDGSITLSESNGRDTITFPDRTVLIKCVVEELNRTMCNSKYSEEILRELWLDTPQKIEEMRKELWIENIHQKVARLSEPVPWETPPEKLGRLEELKWLELGARSQ